MTEFLAFFAEDIFKNVKESGTKNQIIHYGDDDSEEIITLGSDPIVYLSTGWEGLFPADAGTVFDWFFDPAKANMKERSWPFVHPEDGHLYVVRFDMTLERTVNPLEDAQHHSIPIIKMKVLGRMTAIVLSGVYKWTATGSPGEFYCELNAGGDPSLTQPTKVMFNRVIATGGTMALDAGEWVWDDGGGGFNTVVVRLADDADPDSKDDQFIEIG